nr:LytTR family DNA-binding domain-containing protein [uncultured Arsenicibacter sp.]
MKVLIIEDEFFSAEKLRHLLQQINPAIEVLAILPSVAKALAWFRSNPEPDLIFSDIRLEDKESFALFNELTIDAPVIYTTAYDQYAIQAFKQNSVDYLLKPIDSAELRAALKKFEQQELRLLKKTLESAPPAPQNKPKERFLVKKGNAMTFVKMQDVAYFRSDQKLTFLVSSDGQKYIIDTSLDDLQDQLDPHRFARISRSRLISIDSVQKIHPHFNGRLKLDLLPADEEEVFVSRDRVQAFKDWVDS